MCDATRSFQHFWSQRQGTISILSSVAAPLVVISAAVGLNYGNLMLQSRSLQKDADLAAIVAASDIANAEAIVLRHFALNGRKLIIRDGDTLITPDGKVKYSENVAFNVFRGYAKLVRGHYVADLTVAPGARFVANAPPYDAIKVSLIEQSDLSLASAMAATAPRLGATGTATSNQVATFSIGSRLASLNGGIVNATLGGLLGTTVNLSAMDYDALLQTDINALAVVNALATDLALTAGSYDDLLAAQINFSDVLSGILKTPGLKASAASAVNKLQHSLGTKSLKLSLGKLVNLDAYRSLRAGTADTLAVNANLFDFINAAANISNVGKQISVDLANSIAGLGSTKLVLAIGEADVPQIRAGKTGSIVRTTRTRINLVTTIDGLSAIAGLKLRLSLYVSVANAEATLSKINCVAGSPASASVDLAVKPGIVDLALGDASSSAFTNFGTAMQVTPTTLIDSTLLKITAKSEVSAENVAAKSLTFSPSDIAAGSSKNVSTKDTLTSLTTSLFANLDADIKILFITLGTPKAVTQALADTLVKVTAPIDDVLYNTLLLLGIKVGEADVRVTGASCRSPVLIN